MEERSCIICGKLFIPSHHNQKRCSGPHYRTCPVCGKQMEWTEYERCCSITCTKEKRKASCLEKYGTEFAQQSDVVKDKAAETCFSNLGVKYPSQNADVRKKQLSSFDSHYGKATNPEGFEELQSKRAKTCREKYGVDWSFQSDNNKEKSRATVLAKYGTTNCMKSPEVKAKQQETVFNKYGVSNVMQSAEIRKHLKDNVSAKYGVDCVFQLDEVRDKIMSTNLVKYGVPWYCMTDDCKQASGKIISKMNQSFGNLLTLCGIDYEMEFRIEKYSFDFRVGSTLVEIDPTFTHNFLFNPFDRECPGLPKNYHLTKSQVAQKHGFNCIHVFDWDDWNKVISMLSKNRRKLAGRKCNIAVIDCADDFLNSYHIQGACRGVTVSLGLIYEGELVEVMTFGSPRYNKNYQWELLRLCSRSDVSIQGGASKLFKHFIDNYHPESILSYCDISKFTGNVYKELGFSLDCISEPNKVWSKSNRYVTDNLLRQRGYDQLFNANYGKGTFNEELMVNDGWLPVYDCGQKVFIWRA